MFFKIKTCHIVYRLNGEYKHIIAQEGELVTLPWKIEIKKLNMENNKKLLY